MPHDRELMRLHRALAVADLPQGCCGRKATVELLEPETERLATMKHQAQHLLHRAVVAFLVRVSFVMSALVIGVAPQASANVTYT
jgi:hypothetical protein